MIHIKRIKITDNLVSLYYKDTFIDKINVFEFLDVRRQICENDIDGYYIIFIYDNKELRIDIDKNANLISDFNRCLLTKYFQSDITTNLAIALRTAQNQKSILIK